MNYKHLLAIILLCYGILIVLSIKQIMLLNDIANNIVNYFNATICTLNGIPYPLAP